MDRRAKARAKAKAKAREARAPLHLQSAALWWIIRTRCVKRTTTATSVLRRWVFRFRAATTSRCICHVLRCICTCFWLFLAQNNAFQGVSLTGACKPAGWATKFLSGISQACGWLHGRLTRNDADFWRVGHNNTNNSNKRPAPMSLQDELRSFCRGSLKPASKMNKTVAAPTPLMCLKENIEQGVRKRLGKAEPDVTDDTWSNWESSPTKWHQHKLNHPLGLKAGNDQDGTSEVPKDLRIT